MIKVSSDTVGKTIHEYLWTVPDKSAGFHLKENYLLVSKEEQQLLNLYFSSLDGTLDREAKNWNGEEEKSPLIAKG